jgi:hypothetical protein
LNVDFQLLHCRPGGEQLRWRRPMNQSNHPPANATTFAARLPGISQHIVLALFIVVWATNLVNLVAGNGDHASSLGTALVISSLLASIATFTPALAWPNALLAAGLAAFVGGIAHAINAITGFPFGRLEFMPSSGPLLFGLIPWWLPLAWSAIALSARGSARLILHGSRNHPRHGYHVLLLATGLAMLPTMELHRFGIHIAKFWQPGVGSSLLLSSGHALHLLVQIAITPLLIDKFPGPRPRNFRPLLVWACIHLLFVLGLALG